MAKIEKILIVTLCALLLAFSAAGCDKAVKKDKDVKEFKKGPDGLVMSFVPNYPPDKFIVANTDEPISILVEVRNKGTYPPQGNNQEDSDARTNFGTGAIHLSGFDTSIIQIDPLSQSISGIDLPSASSVNPGGIDTAEFDGNIVANNILIDNYNPTILVTACYPYQTKATSSICIDPKPFDTREKKVCTIGSQNVPNQGAPIAVTRIDQEVAGGKIQFKISVKNVGKGDVIWSRDASVLTRCDPNQGRLERRDFDRVQLEKFSIGNVDLFAEGKCAPFADGTDDVVKLFNGEGFVICTYDIPSGIQSAYTTVIDVELGYAYRSTISKPIQIRKIETVG